MSIFFLVLNGMSKTSKKIPNINDQLEESADFGHIRPFLACLWPVVAPISVSKAQMRIFDLVLPGLSEVGKTF